MVNISNIVVIGAGIVGCSIAYNLAKKGAKGIVVLEKEDYIAKGSTGLSASGIRAQFSSEINIKLSLESMKILEGFEQDTGINPEFKHIGYLFLISSQDKLAIFKKANELYRKFGMEVDLLSPEEVNKRYPHLYIDDLLTASFHHRDGYVNPVSICTGYFKEAKRFGVNFQFETEAIGFEVNKSKITAVNTTKGRIETPLVINASGPYAYIVGKMANLDIPALPFRRLIAVTEPFPYIKDEIPLTVDTSTGLFFRKEGQSILMYEADKNEPSSFNLRINWNFIEVVIEHAVKRVPLLKDAKIHRHKTWAGLYSITPDNHPIIGEMQQLPGFYNVVGFSGHGIMHSPAIGKCVAEMILNGKSKLVDISSLGINRFEGGKKGIVEQAAI